MIPAGSRVHEGLIAAVSSHQPEHASALSVQKWLPACAQRSVPKDAAKLSYPDPDVALIALRCCYPGGQAFCEVMFCGWTEG